MVCINLCFALQWRNFVFYEVISLICNKKGGIIFRLFRYKVLCGLFLQQIDTAFNEFA